MKRLLEQFDFTRLSKLPGWIYYFWAVVVVVILVCSIQEATNFFYGPSRTVQGAGKLFRCTVSSGWADTLLYLPVVLAWFVYCSSKTRLAAILVLLVLGTLLSFGSAIIHELDLGKSGSQGWYYNGLPAHWLLRFDPVVEFVADPAGEVWFFINWLLAIIWGVTAMTWWGFYRYPLLPPGGVCAECEYDLRGSPSMQCPECGFDNRRAKQE